MNISLEVNIGEFLKFYNIKPRANGKIILEINSENVTKNDVLCSLLFENKDAFECFMHLSLEEIEDSIIEHVISLKDYNNNTHYSKYNTYYSSGDIIKDIYKLFRVCINTKEYKKTDLKNICYSYIPQNEDTSVLPYKLFSSL